MKNRKLLLVLSVAMALMMSLSGTLAYLTDTDSDVNVMTLGNVDIEQLEKDAQGNDFVQAQPLYPVYVIPGEEGAEDVIVGAIDKVVTVKNIGKSDAYVRTAVAFEAGEMTDVEAFKALIHAEFAFPEAAVNWVTEPVTINDMDYFVAYMYYPEALEAGKESTPSLLRVWMDPSAENDDIAQFGNTFDMLVISQAVQTANFENVEFKGRSVDLALARAMLALDTSFGPITAEAHPWVNEEVTIPGIITSFEEIKAVRGQDGSYALGADFTAENIIHFGTGNVELNLNGKEIVAGNQGQYVIGAQNGAQLRLTGNGTVAAGKGFLTTKGGAQITIDGGNYHTTVSGTLNNIKHTSLAQNDSKIVINGGTFTTDVVDAALFFATSNGVIEVNGGFFQNTADSTPDLFSMGTNKSNTNRIIFKGGTFVNWNPLEDRMCYTGAWPADYAQFSGPWMLVWDGYEVVSEPQENGDVWYTVVKK